jgi:hypothetical protein
MDMQQAITAKRTSEPPTEPTPIGTVDQLDALGRLLYGEQWITPMARDLKIHPDTLAEWAWGRRELQRRVATDAGTRRLSEACDGPSVSVGYAAPFHGPVTARSQKAKAWSNAYATPSFCVGAALATFLTPSSRFRHLAMRRDPAVTRKVHLPWPPTQTGPCGSGDQYGVCCRRPDGSPYKKIGLYKPPPSPSGHSHPGCYINWTRDCSPKISGEHFISETVLSILNPRMLRIGGAAWKRLWHLK